MTNRTDDSDPWLAYATARPASRLRLFCLPYAGGGAYLFRDWADDLPADVDVCPIQLPGRDTRSKEQPFIRLGPLVRALARALEGCLDRPFAIFGYSMGALIAFELARELRRREASAPVALLVAAHRAPDRPDPCLPAHELSDERFIAELRRLGGTPEKILQNPELMAALLPILRADFALCERYVYQPGLPLETPIFVFGGARDVDVPVADLEGWKIHSQSAVITRTFPGDHFFLHSCRSEFLAALAETLAGVGPNRA